MADLHEAGARLVHDPVVPPPSLADLEARRDRRRRRRRVRRAGSIVAATTVTAVFAVTLSASLSGTRSQTVTVGTSAPPATRLPAPAGATSGLPLGLRLSTARASAGTVVKASVRGSTTDYVGGLHDTLEVHTSAGWRTITYLFIGSGSPTSRVSALPQAPSDQPANSNPGFLAMGITLPSYLIEVPNVSPGDYRVRHDLRQEPSARLITLYAPLSVVATPPGKSLGAGATPPTCSAPAGASPTSLTVALKNTPAGFGSNCYYAAAGVKLSLTLVDGITFVDMSGASTGQVVPAQLVVSPASAPAIRAVPGQPHELTGDYTKGLYLSPELSSNSPYTASIGPLSAGSYVLQLTGTLGAAAPATLIVSS